MSYPIVVVTGAAGFVGSNVIKQLLESGKYIVRATVRDPNQKSKTDFLRAMPSTNLQPLQLVAADLTTTGSFDEAVKDATFVIHTAAFVALTAPNPQEIVDTNVNGVKNVLSSCAKAAKAGTLKKVVVTSSMAAIHTCENPDSYIHTEADWNTTATVSNDPYPLSKVQTEKVATAFLQSLPADEKFEICFVNPGAILGPPLSPHHNEGSVQIVHDLMVGKFPMAPRMGFAVVDVRDVARAHIQIMETPGVTGRFLMALETLMMAEISAIGKEKFPQYVWPTWVLPNAMMYAVALFDKRISITFCRRYLGRRAQFSNQRIKDVFDFKFIDAKECVWATAQSLIDIGVVPKK